MAERTEEQILDQLVFAVAEAREHYGPGFNKAGLRYVRECLSALKPLWADATYRVDCYEDDLFIDFHHRIITPEGWDKMDFDEIVRDSQPE